MQWSTPLRVANGEALQLVPNELYLEIFEYIDHATHHWQSRNQTLKRLALVCRYFHYLATPRLFKTLEITSRHSLPAAILAPSTIFCASILRRLKRASSIACHVQDFSISLNSWDSVLAADNFLTMFADVLGDLPNLQSLTLNLVTVNGVFLTAICELRSLKFLSFTRVHFQFEDKDEGLLKHADNPPLAIQELSLTDIEFSSTNISDLNNIIAYIVDLAQLKRLTVSHWIVAEGILMTMKTSSLVKLIVNEVEFYDILLRVLEISKSLEILEIRNFTSPRTGFPTPPLPKLRRLVCPSFMLCLVTGRPISSIEITTDALSTVTTLDGMTTDTLSLIKGSSAILKDISIPLYFYQNTPIFEALPHIESLRIDISKWTPPDEETWLETIVHDKIPKRPQVMNSLLSFALENTTRPTNLFIQLDLLHQLTFVFPNLLEARLVKSTQWRRVTIRNHWRFDSV